MAGKGKGKTNDFDRPPRQMRGQATRELRKLRINLLLGCEGTETEPNYFEGLASWLNTNGFTSPALKIERCGRNTVSLVEKFNKIALEKASGVKSKGTYVLMDYDGNPRFDEAVRLAKQYNITPVWSNECFELWFYLHFVDQRTEINRQQLNDRLSEIFQRRGIVNGYQKSSKNVAELLMAHGDVKAAIERAHRLHAPVKGNPCCSECNPCTTVYELIELIFKEAGYSPSGKK